MTDAHGSYPMSVAVSPVLDTADIVAAATGVIKEKLHSLWENPNACYWREVVHVVWEQLCHVCPVIQQLPPSFVMPNHVITADCWIPSLAMVEQMKSWPDWDKIVDTPDADLQDHAWYQVQFQGEVDDVHASNDAGEEHRGWTRSHPACRKQHSHSWSQKHQKGMTSTPTLNMDDNMLAAMELTPTLAASMGIHGCCMVAINSPPDGFSIVEEGQSKTPTTLSAHPPTPGPSHKRHASSWSVTPGISRGSSSNHPKSCQQILDGVVIVTPSWLTTTSWPSTPGSVAASTGSTPPTTPSSTGSAGSDNTARIDALEAEVLALKKELVVKSHQLDDTQCKVSSLHDIVEALQQEHYPLAQGLMGPIHHTTTPQPGPMLPSTCCAITPAMVTPLGYTQQVDLALTTMVEEVSSHPNTLINDMSEVQQQPPTPASIEDAPTHTDGATAPDTSLVLATPAIIVSTPDDAILIGSSEDNGANNMHVD
ncbi:hypothetical protein J3A83DRAFT_4187511 [Scleroderma citrinum]